MAPKRLLLISNSRCFGRGYLEHCAEAILARLGPIRLVTFVPYALQDWADYTQSARQGFAQMGIAVEGVHETASTPAQKLRSAQAIFVGGGNTFRLLDALYRYELIAPIREAVAAGIPYLGSSAGTVIAGPTIKTTNDMPIIGPPSLSALELVRFQINPHYVDVDPGSRHMGETRDERLAEFHEENDAVVVGLREGAWITVEDDVVRLGGETGAKLFIKGSKPTEWNKKLTLLNR